VGRALHAFQISKKRILKVRTGNCSDGSRVAFTSSTIGYANKFAVAMNPIQAASKPTSAIVLFYMHSEKNKGIIPITRSPNFGDHPPQFG